MAHQASPPQSFNPLKWLIRIVVAAILIVALFLGIKHQQRKDIVEKLNDIPGVFATHPMQLLPGNTTLALEIDLALCRSGDLGLAVGILEKKRGTFSRVSIQFDGVASMPSAELSAMLTGHDAFHDVAFKRPTPDIRALIPEMRATMKCPVRVID